MKSFKKYYLVLLLILCLSSGIIYGSYALYTTGADFSNAVEIGTDITYKFDINNTESIVVSNNSNFRFKGSLTNTIGSTMNYNFYYKVEGASSGVTVKEVASSTSAMKSNGSIANGATVTPEFYITNTSGSNITVTVGVNFAYSGNPVTLDSGTNAITETISSSEAKTGNCTGESSMTCKDKCWTEYDSASGNGVEVCSCYTGNIITGRTPEEMLAYLGLTSRGEMTSVSSVVTGDEGVYSSPDDYGTSYFFRGAVINNYVKFAGAYWRIIRINGDGTIRMIYDGTSAHANGDNSADRQLSNTSKFNTSYNDNAYVGYMYGATGQSGSNGYANTHANTTSSTIKGVLDNWYKELSSENEGYIADRVFCGDRQVASNSSSFTDSPGNTFTSYGYGTQRTMYEEGGRSYTNGFSGKTTQEISFICGRKEDKYTAEETAIGNGALEYPVGLITASEVRAAGGKTGTNNSSYYLYIGQGYWTMSPSYLNSSIADVFIVYSNGNLNDVGVNNAYGVRPVVSLKSDITFSGGNGSQGAPWVVGDGENYMGVDPYPGDIPE